MNGEEQSTRRESVWGSRIFHLARSEVTSTTVKSLGSHGPFRVATLCEAPRALKHLPSHTRRLALNSSRKPIERTKWIFQFPTIYQFFASAVEAHDNLYVISQSGTLTKLAVLAFLIGYEHNTLAQSLHALNVVRNEVFPEVMWYQLQLWAAMGGQLDDTLAHYQQYQVSPTPSESISRSTSYLDAPKRLNQAVEDYREGSLDVLALPSLGREQNWGYCCRVCGSQIFNSSNILKHNPHTDFQPVLSAEYPCNFVSVEPLRWMNGGVLAEERAGPISCYGCGTKIGVFSWEAITCSSCSVKLPCAFLISLQSLRYVPPKLHTKSSGAIRRQSTKLGLKSDKGIDRVAAASYEDIPKTYQKMLQQAKISPEQVNTHWNEIKRVLLFTQHLRLIDVGDRVEEERDAHESRASKLHYMLQSLRRYAPRMGLEGPLQAVWDTLPSDCPLDTWKCLREHPVVATFLEHVEKGAWKPCQLPLMDIHAPEYIELATEYFLNSANPEDIIRIGGRAGRGGYGSVYHAKDLSLNRLIAVKKMEHGKPSQQCNNFREIAALALSDHPNIVKYLDCFLVDDEVWLTMQNMTAGSLQDLQGTVSFDVDMISFIATECLKGLKFLHDNGLCHRDIKPGNIMLTRKGSIKLIDFGLCDSTQSIIEYPRMVGSPYWMPPEMILNLPQTTKIDSWSLGCTLLQLCDPSLFDMGPAIQTMFTVALEGRWPHLAKRSAKMDGDLRSFLEAALDWNPVTRASVTDLLAHPFTQRKLPRKCLDPLLNRLHTSSGHALR